MKGENIKQFSDGIRMIMLCQRNKDGRDTNKTNRASKRKISANGEEFFKILKEFREIKNNSDKPLRIYSCVNKRDIKKAIRNFKQEQLDADYYDEDSRNKFYFDIRNRWISSLMKQNCRAETKFLIDIDHIIKEAKNWDISYIEEHLEEIGVKVILKYPTKNGYHIITEPFNPTLWNCEFGEVKKDALLLLDY